MAWWYIPVTGNLWYPIIAAASPQKCRSTRYHTVVVLESLLESRWWPVVTTSSTTVLLLYRCLRAARKGVPCTRLGASKAPGAFPSARSDFRPWARCGCFMLSRLHPSSDEYGLELHAQQGPCLASGLQEQQMLSVHSSNPRDAVHDRACVMTCSTGWKPHAPCRQL